MCPASCHRASGSCSRSSGHDFGAEPFLSVFRRFTQTGLPPKPVICLLSSIGLLWWCWKLVKLLQCSVFEDFLHTRSVSEGPVQQQQYGHVQGIRKPNQGGES
ncbi:hypothetical protein BaRGS_00018536 [Batillaria attramentaria]|uniref:Uncharacterized protein n=1 Tax=Batillaria attramentaria TaxID=370345 RepID=A0ABD0KT27_9CAEN